MARSDLLVGGRAEFSSFILRRTRMFFRKTRQRWQQQAISRREAVRRRREEKIRRRLARVEEIKRRLRRACQFLVAGLVVAFGCCLAGFVYGAYSAGRDAYASPKTPIELTSTEASVPAAAASFSSPSFLPHEAAVVGLLPDPARTPGETDLTATLEVIAGRTMSLRRHVSKATSECAWIAYSVATSERERYRLDHLIPIELGGASDSCRNLWPQSIADAARKDRLETALNALVRRRQVSLLEAQTAIRENWIAAYAKYVMKPPIELSATQPSPPIRSGSVRRPSVIHAVQNTATSAFACGDGSASRSEHRRGACSHHGGIR